MSIRPERCLDAFGALAAVCALLAAPRVRADEYSWQLSGAERSNELGDLSDTDSGSIDATYHFTPVDDTAGPYALASFLHPTARVSASASRTRVASRFVAVIPPDLVQTEATGEGTAYGLSGRYVWPRAKWYAGGSLSKGDTDGPSPASAQQAESEGYSILAGKYLGPNTTLEVSVGSTEQTSEARPVLCLPELCVSVPITTELDTTSTSLAVFHVHSLRSMTYSVEGRISQADPDVEIQVAPVTLPVVPPPSFPGVPPGTIVVSRPDAPINPVGGSAVVRQPGRARVYSAAGELFPTRKLGLRLGYSRPDGDVPDGEGYDFAATWFFKPRVAVQFSFARTRQDDAPAGLGHSDTLAMRFLGRL